MTTTEVGTFLTFFAALDAVGRGFYSPANARWCAMDFVASLAKDGRVMDMPACGMFTLSYRQWNTGEGPNFHYHYEWELSHRPSRGDGPERRWTFGYSW